MSECNSILQNLAKAQKYCAYQERSQQEVRDKLYEWGEDFENIEPIIAQLIIEGFINEERFAIAFARGKFRIKHWGKIKIAVELKKKRISPNCIKIALSSIPDDEYSRMLQEELNKKLAAVKESNIIKRNWKVSAYLVNRGFEQNLIWDLLKTENI